MNFLLMGLRNVNFKFVGKEWREFIIGEFVIDGEVLWVDMDILVEDVIKVGYV